MNYRLYPWQEECLKKWERKQYHGIVNVVTGAGKTWLALAAAKLLARRTGISRLRIKIVVPTASLLTQWVSSIRNFFDSAVSRRDIGLYYSDRRDTPDRPFMIYVINSARYTLARHIVRDVEEGRTVFLIADECHRYTGSENRKIFDFLPFVTDNPSQYASLGLSATPGLNRPENAAVLIPALGPEIFRYGFLEAGRDETLCPYAAFHVALSFTPEEETEYEELSAGIKNTFYRLTSCCPTLKELHGSDFFRALRRIAGEKDPSASLARLYLNLSRKRKNLTSDACSRIRCVLKLIGLLEKSAGIIIFGERIEQADILYEKLNRLYPNQTARCHSAMPPHARKLALERFRDGEVRILISCRALDEGFDVPSASIGIVMSSTSVNRQRIQRLGRILRRYEGKEIASLYYLYVEESCEETAYFPAGHQTAAICELFYRFEDDTIFHPNYEKQALAAMQTFSRKKPDASLLSEAEDCYYRGIIRPDWLMGKAYCAEKIETAKTISARNYWICMKQIAREN